MSEYQYYEFLAVDRSLDKAQMAELRQISSRAEITAHRFVNRYNYGDLRAQPLDLVERYFDVFVYVANWGTHWFMVRLPRADVDFDALRRYQMDPVFHIHQRGEFVILEFQANDESGEYRDWEVGEEWMPELIGLRAELADGDLRAPYLAWLTGIDFGDSDDDAPEPQVPPGLTALSPALESLARFMRVRDDLLDLGKERSDAAARSEPTAADIARWVRQLPASEKDDLLIRAITGDEPRTGAELKRRFRREAAPAAPPAAHTGRTAGQLFAAAEARADERARIEEQKRQKAEAQRRAAAAAARDRHLDTLKRRGDVPWREIEEMVATKKPTEYDRAVNVLTDLRDIADRDGAVDSFWAQLRTLRERHAKKVSFLGRLDDAGLEE